MIGGGMPYGFQHKSKAGVGSNEDIKAHAGLHFVIIRCREKLAQLKASGMDIHYRRRKSTFLAEVHAVHARTLHHLCFPFFAAILGASSPYTRIICLRLEKDLAVLALQA
eukprot:1158293-Pelagomonas_calceolata.AAC.9